MIVVAVDGPAGSGKSSVCMAVARKLGFRYLDTGAAYRAVAWYALEEGALEPVGSSHEAASRDEAAAQDKKASLDEAQAEELLRDCALDIATSPSDFHVSVNEQDVTAEIREPRVSAVVSAVSAAPLVRQFLNDRFRAEVERAANDDVAGIIVEGRDITTVVLPEAHLRVLLTASPDVRAARREHELDGREGNVQERDKADSKVSDFMAAAPGVHTIDSTELSFNDTVDAVSMLVEGAVN